MQIKQVLVIRKDLKMRRGKEISQCAHASMKVFFDNGRIFPENTLVVNITPQMKQWIEGIFTKIAVYVESEQELVDIYKKAKEAGCPCSLIEDNGLTEFKGVKTKTVVAIGPDESEIIDKITGHLKLY